MLALRGKPATLYLTDLSAVVTAWLIALTFRRSPLVADRGGDAHRDRDRQAPLRRPGAEPFNPAMVAFCTMIVAFPALMSQWPGRDSSTSTPSSSSSWAVPVSSTPSPQPPAGRAAHRTSRGWRQRHRPAAHGGLGLRHSRRGRLEWIALAYLVGGLFLLQQRIITWHMPAAFLLALAACALLMWGMRPDRFASPLFHIASGGSMLAAFFIVTDPVSAPPRPRASSSSPPASVP